MREDENSVIVRGNRYTKLECVGRGGSSKVFKVRAMIAHVCMHVAEALSRGGQCVAFDQNSQSKLMTDLFREYASAGLLAW